MALTFHKETPEQTLAEEDIFALTVGGGNALLGWMPAANPSRRIVTLNIRAE